MRPNRHRPNITPRFTLHDLEEVERNLPSLSQEAVSQHLCETYARRGHIATPPILEENSEFAHFERLADQGYEHYHAVVEWIRFDNPYEALSVICDNDNWQGIAFALGKMFYENADQNAKIANGHKLLRELVISCVSRLRSLWLEGCEYPDTYDHMIDRVFQSHGYPAP